MMLALNEEMWQLQSCAVAPQNAAFYDIPCVREAD